MPIPKYGLDFNREKKYKAIIDQEGLDLPSMYTLTIERIKLGKLNEENKKRIEFVKKNNPELANKKFVKQPKTSATTNWLKNRLNEFDEIKSVKQSTTILTSDNASNSSSLMPHPFIITNDLTKIFHNSTNNSSTQNITMPTNLPFTLPPNFQGTIMIQPTIHVHSNEKYIKNEITKYRQIIPKGGLPPCKKRKK